MSTANLPIDDCHGCAGRHRQTVPLKERTQGVPEFFRWFQVDDRRQFSTGQAESNTGGDYIRSLTALAIEIHI